MTLIVVDASFSLAQVIPLSYSPDVVRRMEIWQSELPHLMVPGLWEYDIVSGLRRACFQKLLTLEETHTALDELLCMAVEVVPNFAGQHALALEWAERLGQSKAYDAQYLALAAQAGAEFWTGDKRLANNAAALGLSWVHWVGEE